MNIRILGPIGLISLVAITPAFAATPINETRPLATDGRASATNFGRSAAIASSPMRKASAALVKSPVRTASPIAGCTRMSFGPSAAMVALVLLTVRKPDSCSAYVSTDALSSTTSKGVPTSTAITISAPIARTTSAGT